MKPSRLQTIVVPLDGSTLAECAVPIALGLLSPDMGRLILMRVPVYTEMQPAIGAEYNMFWPEIRDEPSSFRRVYEDAEAYLAHVATRCERRGITVEKRVEEGDRAGAVIDVAADVGADLIVMTTHGRTGISRWIIGSITERVLHDAPCPVLAIHAQPDCLPDRPATGFASRILVPLDGSELAEPALPPAMAIARQTGGEIILFRVGQPGTDDQAPKNNAVDTGTPEAPSDYLERIATECRQQGVTATAVTIDPVGSGAASVAGAILDMATGSQVDLIAMSTHGRSGLRRWVYGSVTEKVLHNSESALLIVRP